MRREINLVRTLKAFRCNVSRKNPFLESKPLLCGENPLKFNTGREKMFGDRRSFSTCGVLNYFRSGNCYSKDGSDKAVINFTEFQEAEDKSRKTFHELVYLYEKNFPERAGVVDFIQSALKHMREFGVHQDLETYRKLIDLMPKGKYVATNILQVELKHYPREQDCILALLNQMEDYGVMPDVEICDLLISIFGKLSFPQKKYYRMMYWTSKFKNLNPWLMPSPLPDDTFSLAKLAIEKITSVDLQTEITVFRTEEVVESIDKTWIVSGQSPDQRSLLNSHDPGKPVIVEGGDFVWIENERINYFVLKSEDVPCVDEPPESKDDVSNLQVRFLNPEYKEESEEKSVHKQEDGIIYAVCATGTSQKDSLLSWVRLLQKHGNPVLEDIPVLFRFHKPYSKPVPFSVELTSSKEKTSE